MNYIFHFFTILFIINEFLWITSKDPIRFSWFLRKHLKRIGLANMPEKIKSHATFYTIWNVCIFIWILAGLATFNWVLFATFIAFNLVVIKLFLKGAKFKRYFIVHKVNSVIGLIFGVFVIVNAFHLRIDLLSFLK